MIKKLLKHIFYSTWEYKIYSYTTNDTALVQEMLDRHADLGWENYAVNTYDEQQRFYFKRKI